MNIPFSAQMILALQNTKKETWLPDPINPDKVFKYETRRIAKSDIPPYKVGDVRWVREPLIRFDSTLCVYYEADRLPAMRDGVRVGWDWKRNKLPARFCPRWASRESVKIMEVYKEPLQAILPTSVVAEGFQTLKEFIEYWNKLNAHRGFGWDVNPDVWAIGCMRLNTGD